MSLIDAFRGSAPFVASASMHTLSTGSGNDHVRISTVNEWSGSPLDRAMAREGRFYKVTINGGQPWYMTREQLQHVRFDLGAGNDRLEVDASVDVGITADGGAGHDVLIGGSGGDVLHGGSGDDVIRGGAGSDKLYGDNGNDAISGGADSDSIDGGRGDDTLAGGAHLTPLFGGLLAGGRNADTIVGGGGKDTINGTPSKEPEVAPLRRGAFLAQR